MPILSPQKLTTALPESAIGREWLSKLFHDQISTKDGAGLEDRTHNLLNNSRTSNPIDSMGPAYWYWYERLDLSPMLLQRLALKELFSKKVSLYYINSSKTKITFWSLIGSLMHAWQAKWHAFHFFSIWQNLYLYAFVAIHCRPCLQLTFKMFPFSRNGLCQMYQGLRRNESLRSHNNRRNCRKFEIWTNQESAKV